MPEEGAGPVDVAVALETLRGLVGKDLRQLAVEYDVTVFVGERMNKGWPGHVLEAALGLRRNSAQVPNGVLWELKCVSVVQRQGLWVPKETMQITMINPRDVLDTPFEESHLYSKLRRVIICARQSVDREESTAPLVAVNDFNLDSVANHQLRCEVENDYENVRQVIRDRGFTSLSGTMGVWVQPRTKGPRNSTSRAFYARKGLVRRMLGFPQQ